MPTCLCVPAAWCSPCWFSPGGGELPLTYASLIEDLASHGHVIAGIVPAYSESCVYSDARIVDRQWRFRIEKVREFRQANPGEGAVAALALR